MAGREQSKHVLYNAKILCMVRRQPAATRNQQAASRHGDMRATAVVLFKLSRPAGDIAPRRSAYSLFMSQ
jgi:hypothetical protein